MARRVQGNGGSGTLTGGECAVSRPGCFTALNRRAIDPPEPVCTLWNIHSDSFRLILIFHGDESPVNVGFEVESVTMGQVLFYRYFGIPLGQSFIYYLLSKQNKVHDNKQKYNKFRASSDSGQTSI